MSSAVENGLLIWVPGLIGLASLVLGVWALLDTILRPEGAFAATATSQSRWIIRLVLLLFVCAPVSLPFSAYYLARVRPRLRESQLAWPPPGPR